MPTLSTRSPNSSRRNWRLASATLAAVAALFLAPQAEAQTLPDGFVLDLVVPQGAGEELMVAFEHLPDERIVLVEQVTGDVRVAAQGASTSTVIGTIAGVEAVHPERGLLGVTVDPDWPTRPYLYFHLNHVSGITKIVMSTISGDLTDPASTNLTMSTPYELLNDIPDVNGIHNAGTLRFGPDDMLYVSLGDDAQACQSQDLTSPLGKLLRLDVSTMPGAGSGPPPKADITPSDNPFPGPDEWERLVYAWGLRNPFRFEIDFPTGDLFIGSVGSADFEEINFIPGTGYTGNNYGWPQWEGTAQIFCCGTCGQGNTFTDAIHLIPHPAVDIISVTGGPVMRNVASSSTSFPLSYDGDYFYFEYFSGTLHRLTESGGSWNFAPAVGGQPSSEVWASGLFAISDAQLGPEGALWLLANGRFGFPGGLYRISRDPAATDVALVDAPTALLHAYPNPTQGTTQLNYTTPAHTRATLTIHDAAGRLVRRLSSISETTQRTTRRVTWDGRDGSGTSVATGIYFARLELRDERGVSTRQVRITRLR